MRRAFFAGVAFVAFAAFACAGDDDDDDEPAETPTTTADATTAQHTATQGATPAPSVDLTPTPLDTTSDPTMILFRAFAQDAILALTEENTRFFIDRAERAPRICEGVEMRGPCLGLAAGETAEGIPGNAWRSDAFAIFTDEEYSLNLTRYRESDRADLSDAYGAGELRLFALASQSSEGEATTYEIITTSITDTYPSTDYPALEPFREAHVFKFSFTGADWKFIGETAAAASSSSFDWLSGVCDQCYDYWEPWKE